MNDHSNITGDAMAYGTKTDRNVIPWGSAVYLGVQTSATATSTFTDVGFVKDVSIEQTSGSYSEQDFTGTQRGNRSWVESVKVSWTWIEKNADIIGLLSSSADVTFSIIILGSNVDVGGATKRETWFFAEAKLDPSFSYNFNDGNTPVAFNISKISSAFTATTSSMGTKWDISAQTLSQNAESFYNRTDQEKTT